MKIKHMIRSLEYEQAVLEYEQRLQEELKKCKIISFTPEENMKIHMELNEGMDEFLRDERQRQAESRQELKTIIFNA